MRNWLGGLPDLEDLGPHEHFAVAEYDDETGRRKSAMFVYENVGERQQGRHPDWTHPRTPPMPQSVPTSPFNPHDFLNRTPTKPTSADHQTSFKITALNSVATGKIVLKRFAKTTGRVLEQIAVMPDYNTPGAPKPNRSGPVISRPFQVQPKETPFSIITLEEAQAREKARKANYKQRQAETTPSKPLQRRQVGIPKRQTMWEDFQEYESPPERQEEVPQSPILSPPRIPDRINRPSRKPLPSRTQAAHLDKSLPDSPSTDSLRRRTQMPPGMNLVEQPDLLAVPTMRGVVQANHRNAVVSQYGLVFENADFSDSQSKQDEEVSWPGTPATFSKKKPNWWQFEGSEEEETDPTQAVWASMEDSLRNGGGIRGSSGKIYRGSKF